MVRAYTDNILCIMCMIIAQSGAKKGLFYPPRPPPPPPKMFNIHTRSKSFFVVYFEFYPFNGRNTFLAIILGNS